MLEKLAEIEYRYAKVIALLSILITIFFLISAKDIKIQTDLSKELPKVKSIEISKEISTKFETGDIFVILIEVDNENYFDIRDPEIYYGISFLERLLERESNIKNVISPVDYGMHGLISSDYKSAVLYVYTSVGASEKNIKSFVADVQSDIKKSPIPESFNIVVTGTPVLRSMLLDLLIKDAALTISLAGAIILFLLLLLNRKRGFLVFLPLVFALIWTLGTMSLLNMPLSISTVGIGAMIIGLGVEYGIFIVKRFEEEVKKGVDFERALKVAIPRIGSAIFASGTTTMIGFLALLLATMPLIQHMGLALALGIFYSLISALTVLPAFIIVFRRWFVD